MSTKRDPKEYGHIRAWGLALQSFPYYIRHQQQQASDDYAPLNAIYRKDDGTWATADQIQRPDLKDYVNHLAAQPDELTSAKPRKKRA